MLVGSVGEALFHRGVVDLLLLTALNSCFVPTSASSVWPRFANRYAAAASVRCDMLDDVSEMMMVLGLRPAHDCK